MTFRPLRRASAAIAVTLATLPGFVQAGESCAALNGYVLSTVGSYVQMALTAGDQITISAGSGSSALSFEDGSSSSQCGFIYNGGGSCEGHVFTATTTGAHTLEKTGGTLPDTLSCTSGGAATTTPTQQKTAQTQGAQTAMNASALAVGSAVNSALNGTGPGSLSAGGLFLSTGGGAGVPYGWVAFHGRKMDGNTDGRTLEFTLGADYNIAQNTRIGLILSQGNADLTVNNQDVTSEALAYGAYVSHSIGDRYRINGFAVFAEPDYNVGGTKYTATRRMASMSANALYQLGNMDVQSFITFTRAVEDHPNAGTLQQRVISTSTGTIGTKAFFALGGPNARGYVGLSGEFNRFDDGVGNEVTHNAGRVGTGFVFSTENSAFSMDLSRGAIVEDTNDTALTLTYDFKF